MNNGETIQIPKEIVDAAIKVDEWAKTQGCSDYVIGPVRNRFQRKVSEEIAEIRDRLKRIEEFLVL